MAFTRLATVEFVMYYNENTIIEYIRHQNQTPVNGLAFLPPTGLAYYGTSGPSHDASLN